MTFQNLIELIQEVFPSIGYTQIIPIESKYLNCNFKDMVMQLTPHISKEDLEQLTKRYRYRYDVECHYDQTTLYPYVKELFEFLNHFKIQFYLCSLKPKASTVRLLEKFDLIQYFQDIKCIDSFPAKTNGVNKREIMEYLFSTYWMKNGETIFVCDTDNDIKTANYMNMPSAVHLGGYGTKESIQREHPTYTFPNYEYLYKIFEATLRDLL